MKKNLLLLLSVILLAAVSNPCFSQSSLDPDSELVLQTVPIYEGVEEFQAKLDRIRQEEGREPLGLVLCGGSARAFCHVGVLKALEENDIVPDFIIANSMGAVIGMLYAYGFSPQKIEEMMTDVNINSYFEPVFPLHGGVLSVRNFEALMNQLLGEESHRVEDCTIPILLLSEDLYTKRQIWHCTGDFAKVMAASFAMSVFMEPVDYILENEELAGTAVKLVDSGTIDIGGLGTAYYFSSNIMMSTAFYDSNLNYNNPIVIINRTMSIGKERVAINDILDYEPLLIRNDVEHFSFMDFQKAKEISQAGYKTAIQMMAQIQELPHGTLSQAQELAQRRKITDVLTDEELFRVEHGYPVKISEPYFGVKLWPVFRVVDFQDTYLYDRDGIALDAFVDLPGATFKLRANKPFFDGVCADVLIQFEPSYFLKTELFGSYNFDYNDFDKSSFYGYSGINIHPDFFPLWCRSFVVTAEWEGDRTFNSQQYLFTTGFKNLFGKENDTYLFIKPYFYVQGVDFNKAPDYGIGGDFESCWNFVSFLGVGEYIYSKYNLTGKVYDIRNRSELYFINKSPDLTFAESLILRQFKFGTYYECTKNTDFLQAAGVFMRGDVSVIGLSSFIMEGGCGWNFNEKKVYGSFNLKCRM